MRTVQKVVAVLVLGLMGLLAALPPWAYTYQTPGAARSWRPAPRAFLLTPPEPRGLDPRDGVSLDLRRLSVEWAGLAAAGGALIMAAQVLRRSGG